jgi:hypothetical protein
MIYLTTVILFATEYFVALISFFWPPSLMCRAPILRLLITGSLILSSLSALPGQTTGSACPRATGPGTDFDLQGFLDGEIKAGNKQIVIPPGRYRLAPRNRSHLSLSDLHDTDIMADGVEMVCTQTTTAIHLTNCSNVRIEGLAVDYDPLPFTEGKIVALAPDKSWMEFQLIDGYPANNLEMRIEIFDPASGELRRSDAPEQDALIRMGPKRYRARKYNGYRFDPKYDTEKVGDIVVCGNSYAPDGAWSDGIVMDNCQNLVWQNLWMFASNSNGMVEHGCDSIQYLRCHFDRRPLDCDFPVRGFARMRSLNAGAIHSFDGTHGPTIIGCVFEFGGDDGVNLHGTYFLVTACQGAEVHVVSTGPPNIVAGDTVEFLPYDGKLQPGAKVLDVERTGSSTMEDRSFLAKIPLTDWGRARLEKSGDPTYKITLDRPVDLPGGSLICAANRMGNGFLIKDCEFSHNRSRGLLIKAGDGQIIGNKMVGNWLDAVLIAPEALWMESGLSNNLVVQNNVIDDCHATAIDVNALDGSSQPLPSGAHSNIKIIDNVITRSRWPNIAVTSTAGLQITGNTLVSSNDLEGLPPTNAFETNVPFGSIFQRGLAASAGGSGSTDYGAAAILNIDCADPVINDNKD